MKCNQRNSSLVTIVDIYERYHTALTLQQREAANKTVGGQVYMWVACTEEEQNIGREILSKAIILLRILQEYDPKKKTEVSTVKFNPIVDVLDIQFVFMIYQTFHFKYFFTQTIQIHTILSHPKIVAYMSKGIGSIEILNAQGDLERVYFSIPPICRNLKKQTKNELIKNVNR